MWPSRLCHESHDSATFTAPSELIDISGYKLLYLYPFLIFKFPRLIIHYDSLRVVLYPSSVIMSMETRLLFNAGICQTWCRMIVLPFGNLMGTTLIPAIAHSCPFDIKFWGTWRCSPLELIWSFYIFFRWFPQDNCLISTLLPSSFLQFRQFVDLLLFHIIFAMKHLLYYHHHSYNFVNLWTCRGHVFHVKFTKFILWKSTSN